MYVTLIDIDVNQVQLISFPETPSSNRKNESSNILNIFIVQHLGTVRHLDVHPIQHLGSNYRTVHPGAGIYPHSGAPMDPEIGFLCPARPFILRGLDHFDP